MPLTNFNIRELTYCSNYHECVASECCERASWPKDITKASFQDFWQEDSDEEACEYFQCNCIKSKWVGSNEHGNYYHCLVCGQEGEG